MCAVFGKYVLLGADGLNLDMLPTFFFFCFGFAVILMSSFPSMLLMKLESLP